MLLLGWDGLQQPCVRLWQALLGLLQRMLHVSANASDTTNNKKYREQFAVEVSSGFVQRQATRSSTGQIPAAKNAETSTGHPRLPTNHTGQRTSRSAGV